MEWRFERALADCSNDDEEYTRYIWRAAQHANAFMRKLYRSGLWMQPPRAAAAADLGLSFLRCFYRLASLAYGRRKTRFQIATKLHMFAHITHALRLEAATDNPTLNPISFSCQADEDFVGKVCSLSRVCHGRTLHIKTLQKYKVNLALRW